MISASCLRGNHSAKSNDSPSRCRAILPLVGYSAMLVRLIAVNLSMSTTLAAAAVSATCKELNKEVLMALQQVEDARKGLSPFEVHCAWNAWMGLQSDECRASSDKSKLDQITRLIIGWQELDRTKVAQRE